MTTWYVDYEGGTDSAASVGNGDSFATRRKRFDNVVSTVLNPGDNIRVMGSPDPTSLGQNATWTDCPQYGIGQQWIGIGIQSSTNATPIVLTLAAGHGLVTGDTCSIYAHTTNTNANGVWNVYVSGNYITLLNADGSNSVGNGVGVASGAIRKMNNAVVTLTTPVTKAIAATGNQGSPLRAAWTPSTNVTCVLQATGGKEGIGNINVTVAAGFTTGKAAYFTLPTTLDLSSYQQISFWVFQQAGAIGAAGALSFCLCSDTTGDVVVNTVNFKVEMLNVFQVITVNTGAALGSSIQSIALYVNTDNAAQTFYFDNIIACKAASDPASLTLSSLISKNTGDEAWFTIQSINDTRIVLDGASSVSFYPASNTYQQGYAGTSESVALYKRETVKIPAAGNSTQWNIIQNKSGTLGSPITYSGGWNRTDMSTQTGETWWDSSNWNGWGISTSGSPAFIGIDKINFVRMYYGIVPLSGGTDDWNIGSVKFASIYQTPIYQAYCNRLVIDTLSIVNCMNAALPPLVTVNRIARLDSNYSPGITNGTGGKILEITQCRNNRGVGVTDSYGGYVANANISSNYGHGYMTNNHSTGINITATNNVNYGIYTNNSFNSVVINSTTTTNNAGGIGCVTGELKLRNVTVNEATEVAGLTAYASGKIYSEKHDGTANNTFIWTDGGMIRTQNTVVHGAAAIAWKFSPTSTTRTVAYPLKQVMAKVACAASSLVTISAWFQRDNTGITGRLVCRGLQLSGITSDAIATTTAGANTWEQLTITFTPTEVGVVEIEAQFYGGTTYNGYVSDMTISQG